jgi:hypothetical protein
MKLRNDSELNANTDIIKNQLPRSIWAYEQDQSTGDIKMRNGLYRVMFKTPLGQGAGVVILSDGQLRGGDDGMYYFGSYNRTGNTLKAAVQTDRHGVGESVLGVDRATLNLTGEVVGDSVTLNGSAKEAAGVPFQVTLSWLRD